MPHRKQTNVKTLAFCFSLLFYLFLLLLLICNLLSFQVVCGNRHTVALTYDNHVYSFGDNTVGQLGINHMSTSRNPPQLVKCLSGTIKSIACGSSHTMILTSETVYGCGSNDYGQLGHEKLDENTFMPMKLGIQNGNQLYLGWDQSVVLKGDCQVSDLIVWIDCKLS